jgi:hypothetical protein
LEVPWHPFYANHVANYRQEPHELRYWGRGWIGDTSGAREDILKALSYIPNNPNYLRDTKFYFEYPDQGIEGWMRFDELQWLYNTAKSMDSIAELGSWKGRSTHALASGCRLGHVTAIDHFRGSKGEKGVHQEAQTEAVFEQFRENTKALTNLTVHCADTQASAEDFPDGSFDLVFIDAEHTYEGVRRDIEAWQPKARIMLAGHDYCSQWPDVQRAVNESVGKVQVEGTIWHKLLREPKVSIIIPTLGRPEKLTRCLQAIRDNAEYRNYQVVVVPDDPPPNNQGVPKLLQKGLTEARAWCPTYLGEDVSPLVMYLGNDCIPQPGFLREAVYSMLRHFPKLDGLIGLNDGYWHGEVATHWLVGVALKPQLDHEFFHTGYHHVGCDNELTERCRLLEKYHWEERAVVHHDHPVNSGQPMDQADEVYRLGWKHREDDLELLLQRSRELGFPFHTDQFRPPVIPRRIFAIWLSDETPPKPPELVDRCLQTQRLPGYEHHLITLGNCFRNDYVRDCLEKKQWARAADYLRLYYLYTQGGIYLDADVEVLRTLPDEILTDRLFCGRENNNFLGNSVIGAEKGHLTLKRCLDRMETEFLGSDKIFEAGMEIFTQEVYAAKDAGLGIRIYEPDWFFPYDHQTGVTRRTENTVMHHHFLKSWVEESVA